MDIVGIGTDIVECLRIRRLIEQHGERFLRHVYTEREIRFCQARKRAGEYFAGFWAAKEAVMKCLGTSWKKGVNGTEMEIRLDSGTPRVLLHGAALELARKLGVGKVLLSISQCRAYATAYATALRMPAPPP
jgi:holo-[acyl-carrier protein] synthase